MRNYEQEQYAFLAHYGTPGMKRPHGLRYKTKHHVGDAIYMQKGIADDVGDWVKKARRRNRSVSDDIDKFYNRSVSDDIDEFYKNKAKGESKDSLRLKRIAQVRATEAMAPIAAAQEKLFKKKKKKELPINQKAMKLFKINNVLRYNYKKKKNAFIRDNIVKPAMEANTPENRAAHIVRKATKKAAEKTTNPFVNGNLRKSMEKQIERAKKKPSNAINTGIKASGSNFISDTRKSMEKQLEKAKRTNRSTYASPSKTEKVTYVTYTPRDKNTNAPRPGHTDEKIMSEKVTTVKSKLYKKQKKK